MYCTTLYLEKRILYRCFFLILSIGLLLQSLTPLQSQEMWDETLLPQTRNRGWVRRVRRRRWIRRRRRCRHGIVHVAFLRRRGEVLLCRLGLVAILLVWNGWPRRQPLAWALLGLPLADAFLSLLSLLWPGVSKVRAYFCLVRGARDLYRLTVVTLFCAGLFRFLSSPKDVHWALLVGSGVRTADDAWARGEIEEDGTWRLEMVGHFIFTYKPRNGFEERVLLFFFRQFRTPESTPKRPFLRQEWLAEWFGVYQELISRWQKYVREGELEKLNGEYDGWVVTSEIRQAIMDIWSPNFWLSAAQVRERLLAAGHISSLEEISESSIHRVAQETGFAEVRRLLREMFKFTADGPEWRDDVLIERVFELNERLMALLQEGEGLTPQLDFIHLVDKSAAIG